MSEVMGTDENKSKVAQLRQRLEEEYESMMLGLKGFSQGGSRHEFIDKKQRNVDAMFGELTALVGEEAALALVVAVVFSEDEPRSEGATS